MIITLYDQTDSFIVEGVKSLQRNYPEEVVRRSFEGFLTTVAADGTQQVIREKNGKLPSRFTFWGHSYMDHMSGISGKDFAKLFFSELMAAAELEPEILNTVAAVDFMSCNVGCIYRVDPTTGRKFEEDKSFIISFSKTLEQLSSAEPRIKNSIQVRTFTNRDSQYDNIYQIALRFSAATQLFKTLALENEEHMSVVYNFPEQIKKARSRHSAITDLQMQIASAQSISDKSKVMLEELLSLREKLNHELKGEEIVVKDFEKQRDILEIRILNDQYDSLEDGVAKDDMGKMIKEKLAKIKASHQLQPSEVKKLVDDINNPDQLQDRLRAFQLQEKIAQLEQQQSQIFKKIGVDIEPYLSEELSVLSKKQKKLNEKAGVIRLLYNKEQSVKQIMDVLHDYSVAKAKNTDQEKINSLKQQGLNLVQQFENNHPDEESPSVEKIFNTKKLQDLRYLKIAKQAHAELKAEKVSPEHIAAFEKTALALRETYESEHGALSFILYNEHVAAKTNTMHRHAAELKALDLEVAGIDSNIYGIEAINIGIAEDSLNSEKLLAAEPLLDKNEKWRADNLQNLLSRKKQSHKVIDNIGRDPRAFLDSHAKCNFTFRRSTRSQPRGRR